MGNINWEKELGMDKTKNAKTKQAEIDEPDDTMTEDSDVLEPDAVEPEVVTAKNKSRQPPEPPVTQINIKNGNNDEIPKIKQELGNCRDNIDAIIDMHRNDVKCSGCGITFDYTHSFRDVTNTFEEKWDAKDNIYFRCPCCHKEYPQIITVFGEKVKAISYAKLLKKSDQDEEPDSGIED